MQQHRGSVLSATTWMFVLSLLLFWAPLLGPLVAGFVGGKKAGSVGNAILAAFLPSLVAGVILFLFASALTALPLFGVIAGAGGFVIASAHIAPLLLGAILGALF
jgi:hypothetical protein